MLGAAVLAMVWQTLRNLSAGEPVMRETNSGVYCLTCSLSRLRTQCGCCMVMSTCANPSSPITYSQLPLS